MDSNLNFSNYKSSKCYRLRQTLFLGPHGQFKDRGTAQSRRWNNVWGKPEFWWCQLLHQRAEPLWPSHFHPLGLRVLIHIDCSHRSLWTRIYV